MAGIQNAREEFEATKTYLTNEELVQNQTEFCVLTATHETGGQYGPTWTLMIVYLDKAGEHVVQQLYLSAGSRRNGVYKENSYRRWFFGQKASYPIHHVILTQGTAQNGLKFNDIADSTPTIEPCPCMTGEFFSSVLPGVIDALKGSEHDEENSDAPIDYDEREHYIEGVYQLSNKMGWPVSMDDLRKKSGPELKKLYKNFGSLAARQGAPVRK